MSVKHWHFHPHVNPNAGSGVSPERGFYEESHVGKVLDLGEHNWHDDSDFYAVVWDDEKNEPKEVTYASTRWWSYNDTAFVDADSSVLAKYNAYLAKQAAFKAFHAAAEAALTAHSGAAVVVGKGRKFPKGKAGTVFGKKHCTWATYHGKTYKVWVKWDDGSGADMVDIKNLTVTQPAASQAAALDAAQAKMDATSAAFAALLN